MPTLNLVEMFIKCWMKTFVDGTAVLASCVVHGKRDRATNEGMGYLVGPVQDTSDGAL